MKLEGRLVVSSWRSVGLCRFMVNKVYDGTRLVCKQLSVRHHCPFKAMLSRNTSVHFAPIVKKKGSEID